MRNVCKKWSWWLGLLLASPAFADSYNSNWDFSLGCPTHDDTSSSGSLSLSSGGFSGSGNCSRLTTGFGKYHLSSSNGGTLRSSDVYSIQMGRLSFVPPVRTTDTTPVFSVAAVCPSSTEDVNWIFIQSEASRTADYFWGRSTMTPTSTTMKKFYDIDGTLLFDSSYSAPVGSCSSGVINVSGTSDFQAKIYSATDWSGFYKTGPGNVSFFAPIQSIIQSRLGSKTWAGLLYSSQDSESSRNVQVTSNAGGSVFTVQPFSDPETNTLATGASAFTDTITITAVNSPLAGMMKGTVSRVDNNSVSVGTTEKVGCLVYETGTGGIAAVCAGKNPADNSTQYAVTFNYKYASATPDTTFNSSGHITLEPGDVAGANDFYTYGAALQSDGKVVVAMKMNDRFGIARFNQDGTLDTSFNGTGIHVLNFGNYFGTARAVAIQLDGKIVAGGQAQSTFMITSPKNFVLARFNSDGSLDEDFGDSGKVITSFGDVSLSADDDKVFALAITTDNKIMAAGTAFRNNAGVVMPAGFSFILARYLSDGSLDEDFDDDGKVVTPIPGECVSLVVQSDGKIVVGGMDYSTGSFTLLRYETDGSLDSGFGNSGVASEPISAASYGVGGLALQTDGKLVFTASTDSDVLAMVRFNTDGSLDDDFDGDGKVFTTWNSTIVNGIALQEDGKIIVTGGTDADMAVFRYHTNGALDNSFDSDGKFSMGVKEYDWGVAPLIQSDGKIVIAGQSYENIDYYPYFYGLLVRLEP